MGMGTATEHRLLEVSLISRANVLVCAFRLCKYSKNVYKHHCVLFQHIKLFVIVRFLSLKSLFNIV